MKSFEARKQDWLISGTYFMAYVSLGLMVGSLGPTLLSLAENTGSSVDRISFIYAARGAGWLCGSWIGGKLFDHFPSRSHQFLSGALLGLAAILFCTPLVSWLWLLIALQGCMAVGAALLDVGTQALIVWIWKSQVNPKMQFLHFCFGVGSFVAPIIIAPLIKSSLSVAYGIISATVLVSATLPLFFKPPSPPSEQALDKPTDQPLDQSTDQPLDQSTEQPLDQSIDQVDDQSPKQVSEDAPVPVTKKYSRRNTIITVLIAMYLFLYVGCEVGYGGYISTYAQKSDLQMDKQAAALLSSAFWFTFTAGRLLGVVMTTYFHLFTLLFMDMVGCMFSIVLLLVLKEQEWAVWVLSCAIGFFMASTFPSAISLPGTVFGISVTGQDTSFYVIGASLGDLLIPSLIGQLFDVLGAYAMLWAVLGVFGLACIPFVLLVLMSDWRARLFAKSGDGAKGYHQMLELKRMDSQSEESDSQPLAAQLTETNEENSNDTLVDLDTSQKA